MGTVLSLPSFYSIHRLQYAYFMLQARNGTNEARLGVCKTLMPDVAAPELRMITTM